MAKFEFRSMARLSTLGFIIRLAFIGAFVLSWWVAPVRGGATIPPCPCDPNEPEPHRFVYYFPIVVGE